MPLPELTEDHLRWLSTYAEPTFLAQWPEDPDFTATIAMTDESGDVRWRLVRTQSEMESLLLGDFCWLWFQLPWSILRSRLGDVDA